MKTKLSKILIEEFGLNQEELAAANQIQDEKGGSIGEILVNALYTLASALKIVVDAFRPLIAVFEFLGGKEFLAIAATSAGIITSITLLGKALKALKGTLVALKIEWLAVTAAEKIYSANVYRNAIGQFDVVRGLSRLGISNKTFGLGMLGKPNRRIPAR